MRIKKKKIFTESQIFKKKKKMIAAKFSRPTVRNFLPYFHRNRFDRQLVDSRRDIPPSWRVNGHWERRRSDTVVGKADAAQFRRYLPIAWRGNALSLSNDIFSRHLFLVLRLLLSSGEKKTVKFGIIGQERIIKRGSVCAVYYA